jgi:hypothetical protein
MNEPNYTMYNNIKIYNGTTKQNEMILNNSMCLYKKLAKSYSINNNIKNSMTELNPSTLTVKGSFSNISFIEEDIIDMLSLDVTKHECIKYILGIYCNFGEIVNENPLDNYVKPFVKQRISNRGRKPKEKKKSQRKKQGSGKYFSSQITFNIYNPDKEKIYKIKLFRNGRFQTPGSNCPNMTDLIFPITVLETYLRLEFLDDNISATYMISVMRNYICRLYNAELFIKLNDLEEILNTEKLEPIDGKIFNFIKKTVPYKWNSHVIDYIGSVNSVGIAEIQNNCERYFGLIIKFHRPIPLNLNKRTTIKILRSGKINFDGGNSAIEIRELYNWLNYIFIKHYNSIFHNPNADIVNDTSSDTGESIYDV